MSSVVRDSETMNGPPVAERPSAPQAEIATLPAPGLQRHTVEFYADLEGLRDVVCRFLGDGLIAGELVAALVVPEHRELFIDGLTHDGFDVETQCELGQLSFIDADELLGKLLVDQLPTRDSFEKAIDELVEQLKPGDRHLRIYGELADVLWSRGNESAAVELERLWCEFEGQHPLSLLCAYAIERFYGRPAELLKVCSWHSQIGEPGAQPQSGAHLRAAQSGEPQGSPSLDLLKERDPTHTEAKQTYTLLTEITRRRHVEAALRASESSRRHQESLLGRITDALPALVSYVDAGVRYRFVNATYERWFDTTRDQILGRHLAEILGPEAYAQIRDHVATALSGQQVRFTDRLSYRAAGERIVDVSYVPHITEGQRVAGFVALVSDVTERERLNRERQVAAERTARLMKITGALAEAVSAEQVFEAVVDQVAATLGASSAGLFQLREDTGVVNLVHALGYSEAGMRAMSAMSLRDTPSIPALDAITTAAPIWLSSQQELVEKYPHLAGVVTPGRSYQVACLPILVQGRARGSVAFTFDDAPPIDQNERSFLQLVARYCSQAVERLRLLEGERKSRAAAEVAAARAGLLSRASRAFSEAGADLPKVMQAIMEQVTAEYAHLCGISLASGEQLRLEAFHHRDADAKRALESALKLFPPTLSQSTSGQVIRTGESLFMPEVDPEQALARVRPEYRPWLERFMPRSVIIAPLRARARIIGTIGAMRGDDAPPFTRDDVRFLEELGERAGMAIESSRLHQESLQAQARTELLYSLARAVIGADDVGQVFDAALETLGRALGTPRAAILTFDTDGILRFRAWRGLSDHYRRAVEGHSPWAADVRDPKPILVPDARADVSLEKFIPLFEREQIGALGFIPLVAGGVLVGKFMVYYDEPRTLAEHELEMAAAIANHVAAAAVRFDAVADLRRAVRFNEMFTGMLGHDLRNPLGAIMTAAQVAIKRNDDERTLKPLSRIISSGQRMARMIDQLLDFTRVRVGQGIPVEPRRVDLVPLLRQVLDELEGVVPGCSVQLHHEGNSVGHWDVDRLSQVFSNLVANAIQHGDPEVGVRVRVCGTIDEMVSVEVHNKGVIPPEKMSDLFEPMTGSNHYRHRSRGLGLGLYITHQIVRAHGGTIDVRSDERTGTTFTALLPRAYATPPPRVRP